MITSRDTSPSTSSIGRDHYFAVEWNENRPNNEFRQNIHPCLRLNLGIDFDCFWSVVSKTLRAEFVEEAVFAPLMILFGDIDENSDLSPDDIMDIFDNALIEEDVLPLMQMAMY